MSIRSVPREYIGKPIRCKAAICRKAGEPLVIEEVELDPPKAWEVRIKILCTSLCHSDVTFWKMDSSAPAAKFRRRQFLWCTSEIGIPTVHKFCPRLDDEISPDLPIHRISSHQPARPPATNFTVAFSPLSLSLPLLLSASSLSPLRRAFVNPQIFKISSSNNQWR